MSTDNTRKIILEYANKYDNIKHIFLDSNSGSAGKPRNIGIKNASADYIMFLDNDDEYVPEACEIFYNKISETNANLIVCSKTNNLHNIDDAPIKINEEPIFEEVNVLEYPDVLYSPITNYAGAMWCKIFKKEFLLENNIECLENLLEDVYFMHKCYYTNHNVLFLTNLSLYNHYFYRIKGQSITVSLSATFLHKVFVAFNKLHDLSLNFENTQKFFNRYCSLFFDELAYYIIISDSSKEEKISLIKEYSECASGLNPQIKSKILSTWCKLACRKMFKLTFLFSVILKFLINVKSKF